MKNKPTWTKDQRLAIGYEGQNLLLSAAAGSGKTATLTERIVSLLTAPDSTAEISRMLVVTFTRAAAAELRDRIGKALREAIRERGATPRLSRQLCDLGRARITTIHSFCLSLLRPYFSEFSLPMGFSVSEPADVKALAREVMGDVVSAFFDEGSEDFLLLADTLGGARDESSLDEPLLLLADKLTAHGMDADDLLRVAENLSQTKEFFASPAGAGTRAKLLRFASHYVQAFTYFTLVLDQVDAAPYLPAAEADLAAAEELHRAVTLGDYEACRQVLRQYRAENLKSLSASRKSDVSNLFQKERKAFRDGVLKLGERNFSLPEEKVLDTLRQTAKVSAAAARVLNVYFEKMAEAKRKKGLVDYGDLEFLAYRLLVNPDGTPTEAAREAGRAFDYIFIDEYQDTNRVQDAIFASIAGSARRFMVGDIKQSIYRFRGAEPEVFASYRRRWAPLSEEDGAPEDASLFMQENFRCDRPVVDFVNLVSRHLFSCCAIPFTKEDELLFGKGEGENDTPAPVEVVLLNKEEGPEGEAEYVAERIARILREEKRADGNPFTPGDVAILLRTKTDIPLFAEALARLGIPSAAGGKVSLYEQPEVIYALSILRAVDNPGRDIDLAAALRGPVFGFTLTDLVGIRAMARHASLWDALRITAGVLPPEEDVPAPAPDLARRCADFLTRFSSLRADARSLRTEELLLRIYDETGFIEICEADPDTRGAGENLRALYDAALRFEENNGGGLFPFLKKVEAEMEEDGATVPDENEAAVRILTIHQSKGLEFPVCFVAETHKRRNTKDGDASLLFDPFLGAVMRLPDPGGLVRCDTPLRQSVSAAINDAGAEEEMRVLYVALTRARERLVVTGMVKNPQEAFHQSYAGAHTNLFSDYTVFSEKTYLGWILNAVSDARQKGEDDSFFQVHADGRSFLAEAEEPLAFGDLPKNAFPPETVEKIREEMAFSYPYTHLASVPAKLTVSRLFPAVLDGGEEEDAPVFSPKRNAPPAFLSGKTELEASFAGTATHAFLQFADFAFLAENGVNAERDRLLEKGFLTEEMVRALRMEELLRFTESALFARMRKAQRILREFRFNAALDASRFTENEDLAARLSEDGVKLTVQGVMDALFVDESGRVVLVDYKTDRLTNAERDDPALAAKKLTDRHGNQLRYYRAVARDLLGRDVDETLIYSLPLGDTVPVL